MEYLHNLLLHYDTEILNIKLGFSWKNCGYYETNNGNVIHTKRDKNETNKMTAHVHLWMQSNLNILFLPHTWTHRSTYIRDTHAHIYKLTTYNYTYILRTQHTQPTAHPNQHPQKGKQKHLFSIHAHTLYTNISHQPEVSPKPHHLMHLSLPPHRMTHLWSQRTSSTPCGNNTSTPRTPTPRETSSSGSSIFKAGTVTAVESHPVTTASLRWWLKTETASL